MGTYTIKLFQTATLANEKGRTPSYRFRDYVYEAFNRIGSSHDVSIDLDYSDPYMYLDDDGGGDNDGYSYEQRRLDPNDSVEYPCYNMTLSYDGIGYYFEDWLHCYDNMDHDIYVILTASIGCCGGAGHTIERSEKAGDSGTYAVCVVEQGYLMPDAPTSFTRYEPEDDSTAAGLAIDAIQTGMHELGHAFMHDYPENRVEDHEVGVVSKTSTDYHWMTPMGLGGDDYNSACYPDFKYSTPGALRWDLLWSDCCQSYWQYPFE